MGRRTIPFSCNVCGTQKPEAFSGTLKSRCRKCQVEWVRRYDRAMGRRKPRDWTARQNAVALTAAPRGLAFGLPPGHLKALWDRQQGLCAYTGAPMSLDGSRVDGVTVDRPDNNRGYDPGNVVLCTRWANSLKGERTLDEFFRELFDRGVL